MHKVFVQGSIIIIIALLLTFLQPAYANGGHIHLGGVFFVLLGGVVFLGGLGVVLYFLLRPGTGETGEERKYD